MFKVIATDVVISKGYDGAPALKFSENGAVSYTHLDVYKRQLYLFTCHDAQVRGFFHVLATVNLRTVCGRQKAEYSFLSGLVQRPLSEQAACGK